MKAVFACILLFTTGLGLARGQTAPRRVELRCHRTANEDSPENSLDSLEQAALLGCDLVEIDVRRTLDGVLILNHDGLLDRLTDGTGDVETTYFADLDMRDAGSWMGDRFAGLHIATLEDALRFAHRRKLRLFLDIKVAGVGPQVLRQLHQEDMLDQVEVRRRVGRHTTARSASAGRATRTPPGSRRASLHLTWIACTTGAKGWWSTFPQTPSK